jgi:hypothetical protein
MKGLLISLAVTGLFTASAVSEAAAWGCAATSRFGPTGRSWGNPSQSAARYVASAECKLGASLRGGMGLCRIIGCSPFVTLDSTCGMAVATAIHFGIALEDDPCAESQ